MKTLLEALCVQSTWLEYFNNRITKQHVHPETLQHLDTFITEKRYLPITQGILAGTYSFSIPKVSYIAKSGTKRKRTIYQYQEDEMYVLKLLSYLIHTYDDLFVGNCYSFPQQMNVRNAIQDILQIPNLNDKYVIKCDIHDYFNSIPTASLCNTLDCYLENDKQLCSFLKSLLCEKRAVHDENIVIGEHGAMAGVPISTFLANLYLLDIDVYFHKHQIAYFRYADDILIFLDTPEQVEEVEYSLIRLLNSHGLSINVDKYKIIEPHTSWTFLGMQYKNGIVDLAPHTVKKIKDKMSRKARSLYRWSQKKNVTFEQTASVYIRIFNRKFYDLNHTNEFTWSKWFFPLINTDKSLKEIDAYFLQNIRYLYSGRYYKGNYAIEYEQIKALGYHSLVHEYYKKEIY